VTQTLSLSPGTIDLAEKAFNQRIYPIGPLAIDASTEVRALIQIGVIRKVNGSDITLCHGGQGRFEEALRAQIQTAQTAG